MELEDKERAKEVNRKLDGFFNRSEQPPTADPEWLDIPLDAESQRRVIEASRQIEALAYRIGAIHTAHELKHGNLSPDRR
ncbi:MAG: hypothetical protein ABJN65_01450 [Parasphingorhabdus sp.]